MLLLIATGLSLFPNFSGAVVTAGEDEGSGVGMGVGVGVGVATGASWVSLTLTVGLEYVKPFAEKNIHPFFSIKEVVATLFVPSGAMIDIVALTGAFENP